LPAFVFSETASIPTYNIKPFTSNETYIELPFYDYLPANDFASTIARLARLCHGAIFLSHGPDLDLTTQREHDACAKNRKDCRL
jgi:hypothetical protein